MTPHRSQTRVAHAKQSAIAAARRWPRWTGVATMAMVGALTMASAIVFKELTARQPGSPAALAATVGQPLPLDAAEAGLPSTIAPAATDPADDPQAAAATSLPVAETPSATAPQRLEWRYDLPAGAVDDTGLRYFNGRPVRAARTIIMLVTAYSPDARSCGTSADGITASLHSVETNGHALVAADRRVLPMGSMLSIPGYDDGQVVPVLDVGGKIKGNRLDVLFPTHEQARAWGVRRLPVVVWEYADGLPAGDWRRTRDGR